MGDRSDSWVSFLARQMLEDATSYEKAKLLLTNTTVLAPVYFILGGSESHEVNCLYCVCMWWHRKMPIGYLSETGAVNFTR